MGFEPGADSNQSKRAICRSSMLAIATDRGFRLLKAVFIGFLCYASGKAVKLSDLDVAAFKGLTLDKAPFGRMT